MYDVTVRAREAQVENRNILISGAGIAGPTLAYWLLRHGFTPTLVEHAASPRMGGYMIDFWGVGYDVAERMRILPALREDGYQLEEVRLVDAAGHRVAGFDAGVFQTGTHGRFVSLLRGDLARRIYERVEGHVETLFGDSITALDDDAAGVTVTFRHAAPRRFDLVVGADGLHSNVRHLLFGDGARCESYLGYYAASFMTQGYPHRDENRYVSHAMPGRQVARYALRGDRSAFFFILAHDTPLALAEHDLAGQKAVLREALAGSAWECDEILERLAQVDELYFDHVAQAHVPHWSKGRVVLLGDAAYCPSLLSGQGSAFAMAGAYELAHALAANNGNHELAFEEYQRRFKPFVDRKQGEAKRFGWWFAPGTALGVRLRNLTTDLLGMPYIGERLVANMLGDRFDLAE